MHILFYRVRFDLNLRLGLRVADCRSLMDFIFISLFLKIRIRDLSINVELYNFLIVPGFLIIGYSS